MRSPAIGPTPRVSNEDSDLKLLLRNAYFNRNYKNHTNDAKAWDQGFIGTFQSGFTQETFGVVVDVYGLFGVKLDSGRGRNYTAFFDADSDGRPADDLSEARATLKLRFSNTVLRYGNRFPSMPVLAYDDSSLLPQAFTGTLGTSKEIEGLELNVDGSQQITRWAIRHEIRIISRVSM